MNELLLMYVLWQPANFQLKLISIFFTYFDVFALRCHGHRTACKREH